MLEHPVELLDGVATVIPELAQDYRLVLITKGDLRDQERKVRKSGLEVHFTDIEIISEKDIAMYRRLLSRYNIAPEEFLMVGNPLKPDILPVLELGGQGIHVPYRITWQAERAEPPQGADMRDRFFQIQSLRELPALLQRLSPA